MTIQQAPYIGALMRYAAMTGELKLTGRSLAQARADRKEYAAHYTADEHRAHARPGLLVRFMYEVCDIPLSEARECVIGMIRESGGYRFENLAPARDIALEIYVHNGNVFAAEFVASMYQAGAEGTPWARYWRTVVDALRGNRLVGNEK